MVLTRFVYTDINDTNIIQEPFVKNFPEWRLFMNSVLKYLLFIVLIAAIGFAIYKGVGNSGGTADGASATSKINDRDFVLAVIDATKSAASSCSLSSFGNQAQIYICDLRMVYDKDGDFYKKIAAKLGSDYNTTLSTGDPVFVGIYPVNRAAKVYVGDPQDPNNMVYPEWKSTKISEK